MKKHPIYSLDLGTTKFCIAALNQNSENPQIEIVEVPAKGMRRGMLSDFDEAKHALDSLIEKAEHELSCNIRQIVVGIAGSHLKGRIQRQEILINEEQVSLQHTQQLCKFAEQQAAVHGQEILHCIPVNFTVGSREPVLNPVGFSGDRLSGQFFIIEADRDYMKDVIRLCNQCGLEVTNLYSEPFASASVTVEDEHKELGVVIADIGGGTTDGIVFQNGRPVDIFTINIAGKMMTRDVALALNVQLDEAERIKRLINLREFHNFKIETKSVHGKTLTVDSLFTAQVIEARLLELGKYIVNSLQPYKGALGAGMLSTGGGCTIQGLSSLMHECFKISVRSCKPKLIIHTGKFNEFDTKYATAIGLLNLELGRRQEILSERSQLWAFRYFGQFMNWIRELS